MFLDVKMSRCYMSQVMIVKRMSKINYTMSTLVSLVPALLAIALGQSYRERQCRAKILELTTNFAGK